MTLRVLVVGLRPVDSGKTTLATSLVSILRRRGLDAVGFKPIGSTEVWLHPEALRWSGEHGVVVTPDALKLSTASEAAEPLDIVEPVAALHAPPDPSRWDWNPSAYEAAQADPNRTAALLRVTMCRAGQRASLHAIVNGVLEKTPPTIASLLRGLSARLSPPPLRVGWPAVAELLGPRALEAADSCLHTLSSRHEIVVIESFSDVAAPTPASLSADIVVAVAPGVAAVIEGRRYSQAVMARTGAGSLSVVTAGEAVHLAGPGARVDLPLLDEPEEGYSPTHLEPIIDRIKDLVGEKLG